MNTRSYYGRHKTNSHFDQNDYDSAEQHRRFVQHLQHDRWLDGQQKSTPFDQIKTGHLANIVFFCLKQGCTRFSEFGLTLNIRDKANIIKAERFRTEVIKKLMTELDKRDNTPTTDGWEEIKEDPVERRLHQEAFGEDKEEEEDEDAEVDLGYLPLDKNWW